VEIDMKFRITECETNLGKNGTNIIIHKYKATTKGIQTRRA